MELELDSEADIEDTLDEDSDVIEEEEEDFDSKLLCFLIFLFF